MKTIHLSPGLYRIDERIDIPADIRITGTPGVLGHTPGEWLAAIGGAVLLLAILAYLVLPIGGPLP